MEACSISFPFLFFFFYLDISQLYGCPGHGTTVRKRNTCLPLLSGKLSGMHVT
jgi:hypothetical protein